MSKNAEFHIRQKRCCSKWVLPNTFCNFFEIKKWFCWNLRILMLANAPFRVGMQHCRAGMFPTKEGGIQVLAGLAPSTQTVRPLLRTSWLAKPTRKKLAKSCSANSLQWEKALNYFWPNKCGIFIIRQSRFLPNLIVALVALATLYNVTPI
jgi:hypothetical protein